MRFWGLWNLSREVVQTVDTPYGPSEIVEEVLTSCRGCMATLVGSEDQASMKPKAIVTGYSLFAASERGYKKAEPAAVEGEEAGAAEDERGGEGEGEGVAETKAADEEPGTSLAASFEQAAAAEQVDQDLLAFIASNPGADERKDWVTNVKQLDEDELVS